MSTTAVWRRLIIVSRRAPRERTHTRTRDSTVRGAPPRTIRPIELSVDHPAQASPTAVEGTSVTGGPVHLAVFSESHEVGGAEVVTGYLLADLDARFRVSVIGVDHRVVESLVAARRDATPHVVPEIANRRDWRSMRETRSVIAALRPTIFQAALTAMGACRWPLLLASTVRGVRTVAVEHSPLRPPDESTLRLKRMLEPRLTAHVAVAESVATSVREALSPRRATIRIIHNGVPVRAAPTPPRSQRPTVGTVARLHPAKGIEVLLRAMAPLEHVRVVIIGDGSSRDMLTALAEELGMRDRTDFVGWVDDPRGLLDTLDVFVSTSRLEGLSLAICEAMMDGVTTIATDVGGARELIEDRRTGIIVPVDDVDGLRAAVVELLADDELRRRLAAGGRAEAARRFTAGTMARAYERLYAEIIGSNARVP